LHSFKAMQISLIPQGFDMHIGNSLVICRSLKCFVTYSGFLDTVILRLAEHLYQSHYRMVLGQNRLF